jgi:hypothetical protein
MTDASRIRHQTTIGREDRSVTVVDEWTLLLRFPYDRDDNAALKKVTRGRAHWDGRRKGYTLVIASSGLPGDVCRLVEKLAAKHKLSVTSEVRLLLAGRRPDGITPRMWEVPKPRPLPPMPPPVPRPEPPPPRRVEELLQVTGPVYWSPRYFCGMCDSHVGGDECLAVSAGVIGKPPRQRLRLIELRHVLDDRASREEARLLLEYLRTSPKWARRQSNPPTRLAPPKVRPAAPATVSPPQRRRWFRAFGR